MNEHDQAVVFSSSKREWQTPDNIMRWLRAVFPFTLDVCATAQNKQCEVFYSIENSAFTHVWMDDVHDGVAYCNPPYGRDVEKWLSKMSEEAKFGVVVVALLPARTSNKWFHKYCAKGRVILLEKRVKFLIDGVEQHGAPFPSMIVIFDDYMVYPNAVSLLGAIPMECYTRAQP